MSPVRVYAHSGSTTAQLKAYLERVGPIAGHAEAEFVVKDRVPAGMAIVVIDGGA